MAIYGSIIRKENQLNVDIGGKEYKLILNKKYISIHFNHGEIVLVEPCGKDQSGRLRTFDNQNRKNSGNGTYYQIADINNQFNLEEAIQQIFGQLDPFKLRLEDFKRFREYTDYKGLVHKKLTGYQY